MSKNKLQPKSQKLQANNGVQIPTARLYKMNLLGLKSEVSCNKMENLPSALRRGNVMLNSFASYISNASEEFSRTPEMSLSEMVSQPRVLLKDSISRISFEQLKSLRNAHCIRNFNKKMYVIWLNTKLINLKFIFNSHLPKNLFTKIFKFNKLKRVFSIFGFPHKVESVLSSCMSKSIYFHFLFSYAKFKNIAHSTLNWFCECAHSVAHFLFYSQDLRNRRFGLPCTKAQGILRM